MPCNSAESNSVISLWIFHRRSLASFAKVEQPPKSILQVSSPPREMFSVYVDGDRQGKKPCIILAPPNILSREFSNNMYSSSSLIHTIHILRQSKHDAYTHPIRPQSLPSHTPSTPKYLPMTCSSHIRPTSPQDIHLPSPMAPTRLIRQPRRKIPTSPITHALGRNRAAAHIVHICP